MSVKLIINGFTQPFYSVPLVYYACSCKNHQHCLQCLMSTTICEGLPDFHLDFVPHCRTPNNGIFYST